MAKIKWASKKVIEQEKLLKEQAKKEKKQFLDREFKTLSTKEKDALLEILAKEHELI